MWPLIFYLGSLQHAWVLRNKQHARFCTRGQTSPIAHTMEPIRRQQIGLHLPPCSPVLPVTCHGGCEAWHSLFPANSLLLTVIPAEAFADPPTVTSCNLNNRSNNLCLLKPSSLLSPSISVLVHLLLSSSRRVIYLFRQAAFVKLITGLEGIGGDLITGVGSKVSKGVNDAMRVCVWWLRIITDWIGESSSPTC